jgi:hypothetical protein
MNNPDHISRSLETIFWVKILKFVDADPGSSIRDGKNLDPGWKFFLSGIRDKHPGSATLVIRKLIVSGFRLFAESASGSTLHDQDLDQQAPIEPGSTNPGTLVLRLC